MARSLKQHFTDWCREQGDREYVYNDIGNCALCQFLNANGYAKKAFVGGYSWRESAASPTVRHRLDDQLAAALVEHPHTFAALAARLSA